MLLNLLTWNINFIHDNWIIRIENINKILEKEVETCDIIALQEATLPFSDALTDIYTFLKKTDINYVGGSLVERNFIYKYIFENFPKYKKYVISAFEYFMNKLLSICTLVYSIYGGYILHLYFNYPYIFGLLCMICPPIFAANWLFIGMLTVINRKIQCVTKLKYIKNRTIQYTTFKYNKKNVIFVNVHLTPGENKTEKRLVEIKEILNFINDYDVVILAGDFNDKIDSNIYSYLTQNNYKSAVKCFVGEEVNTFPSDKPVKCLDYVWVKGDVDIKNAVIFGNISASDHKGIKVTLDI